MPTLYSLVRFSFFSFFGLALLLIFVLISSSPIQERLVVHGQIHSLPREFLVNGDADPNHTLTLTIDLISNNMTGLEQELYAVSDPKSPRYGQHLNKTQVDSFVRPSKEASTTLDQWLTGHDITPISKSSAGNVVKIEVSVSKANQMFNTTFQSVTHTPSNRPAVRAMAYSLPTRLAKHTRGIYPITTIPRPPIVSSNGKRTAPSNATFRRRADSGCEDAITPACIQDLYGTPRNTTSQGATGGVGIMAFNGTNVKGSEVARYLQTFRPEIPLSGVKVEITSVFGGDDSQTDESISDEGTLDTQVVLGISPHSPVTIYPTPGEGEITDLLDIVNFLADQNTLPSVVVINIFFMEGTEESDIMVDVSLCNTMKQLGARGVSILATSGAAATQCIANLFGGSTTPSPGGCPFVTSVGSTMLSSGAEIASTESAGGFSSVFPRQLYQSAAIDGYLKQIGPTDNSTFNASGRAIPDIAAVTGLVPIVTNGQETTDDGTLSSTPIVAAIIADLNAQRQSQGKSPLGFLNPLLYSNPQAFIDITQGNNSLCGLTGFPAVQGWDAITGLGSPNYTALLQII